MRRPSAEVWVLMGLVLVFVVLATLREQEALQEALHSGPSAFSVRPDGGRALFDLSRRRGMRAVRWTDRISRLPSDTGAILLTEPLLQPLSREDETFLHDWLADGGMLIVVVDRRFGRAASVGLGDVETAGFAGVPRTIRLQSRSPLFRDVRALHVDRGPVLVASRPDAKTIIEVQQGALALSWREGKGTVVALSAAIGPVNRTIGLDDNAVLYMNLLEPAASAGKPVVFAELYHRPATPVGRGGQWWRILPGSVRAAGWLLALVLFAAVWNGNHRFGPLLERRSDEGDTPRETAGSLYVTSMASLLRRARQPEIAIEYLHASLLRDLAQHAGVDISAPTAELVRATNAPADLAQTITDAVEFGASIAAGGRATEEKLVSYARTVQTIRRELRLG